MLIRLNKSEPVTVVFPDGTVDEFVYKVEDNLLYAQSQSVSVERGLMTAALELWAYATWSDGSVTIDGNAYLDYGGANTQISQEDTWVSQRVGSNNNSAKARTRGEATTTEPASGVTYYNSFDFEMWLDPAYNGVSYLKINR